MIGEKEQFGIECQVIDDKSNGFLRLYIDGFELGYYNESINLRSAFNKLIDLGNKKDIHFPKFRKRNKNDILKDIHNSISDDYDSTILSLGESFDDFEIRIFMVDQEISFLWKLQENPFFDYPHHDYEVHLFTMDKSDYVDLTKRLSQLLL